MPKSPLTIQLDAIQKEVTGYLKPAGFKKKGRTYNRLTADGLIHVINFQMGEYPIGENYVVPGLRESFYGKFAVNLGVFLPCVRKVEWETLDPSFIQESHCTIRDRLGNLAFGHDLWFDLVPDITALSGTIIQLLEQFGLPFLDTFPDYPSVITHYETHGTLPFQNEGRAALEAALVAFHLGDTTKSKALFLNALSADHDGFRKHVRKLIDRIGIDVG